MTDPRRFLGVRSSEVLPYLGGDWVDARDRRLRIDQEIDPGYFRFEIRGRMATPIETADAPDLSDLPITRGHSTDGYVVGQGSRAELLFLGPNDGLQRFAPVEARRWPTGFLLYALTGFETGVEEEARRAFEERRPLGSLRGVPSTLRGAFGYAILIRAARERGGAASPIEAGRRVGELADGGDEAARRLIDELEQERARNRVLLPERPLGRATTTHEERIEAALRAAGGTLFSIRSMEESMLEVRYFLSGERFVSIIDGRNLQVIDAGICLAGSDGLLTMESLPSAIIEAISRGWLEITRRF